jgi:hypothetical protein
VVTKNLAGAQHSREVSVHDLIPFGLSDAHSRSALGAPGRIDEDIHFPKGGNRLREKLIERIPITNVGVHAQASAPALLDFFCSGFDLVSPAGGSHYVRPGFSESMRNRAADSRGTADHNGDFAC